MAQSSQVHAAGDHLPPMGVHVPWAAFTHRIAAEPAVLGMLYAGSLGRGAADRCPDLDITLCVSDAVIDTPRLLEHYMSCSASSISTE